MGYRPPKRPDPILLGPDAEQRSLVLTGDRISWFGIGTAPRFPRTVHLQGRRGLLTLPRILTLAAHELSTVAALSPDIGACIVLGTLSELLPSISQLRSTGFAGPRIIVLLWAEASLDPLRFSELCSMFLQDDRHRLGWLADSSLPAACLSYLAASGFPSANSDDVAASSHDRSILTRFFGRPSVLAPGSLGDVLLKDASTGEVIHSVIAGRLLLRDAHPVAPPRVRDTLTDPH